MSGHHHLPPSDLTWIGSDRRFARRVGQPVRKFLENESAVGVVLVAATILALVIANSPAADLYHEILDFHLTIDFGDVHILDESVEHLINDGLIAIFFFVVGLEIKRELVVGELQTIRAAGLPTLAAVGGMVTPALLYFVLNPSGPESAGWGIPLATDIAFAVGILSLLGNRVPTPLKLFLLALAIVDDIGAIAVIALFFTEEINFAWLITAVILLVLIYAMQRAKIWYTPIYVVIGVVVWYAFLESGVHATIAGVALGLLTPATPLQEKIKPNEIFSTVGNPDAFNPATAARASMYARESISVAERLQTLLHPFTSFVILPLFALANAGIALTGDSISAAATSRVTLGVILGLVVGKTFGVTIFCWASVKLGLTSLPKGVTWPMVIAVGLLAGIGFTVSLFITGLAFPGEAVADLDAQARIGILVASFIASVGGLFLLDRATRNSPIEDDTVHSGSDGLSSAPTPHPAPAEV